MSSLPSTVTRADVTIVRTTTETGRRGWQVLQWSPEAQEWCPIPGMEVYRTRTLAREARRLWLRTLGLLD